MISKIKGIVTDFTSHWSKPADGKYVPYKEIAAYSVGGMGVNFLAAVFGQFQMSAACMMMGAVYELSPTTMMMIATIATVVGLLFQPFKSAMIDNTRSKKGKVRPYIFWLGPPTAVLLVLTAFMDKSWGPIALAAILGSLYVLLNIIYNFYFGMYTQLAQLLTPNSDERGNIMSVSSIVYSMAPTITSALFPLIGGMFEAEGGLRSIMPYRITFPILCIIGLALGYFAYFGTKERIVVSKQYKVKVKFIDGFKKILRNKFFWIANISSWFNFAKTAVTMILTWSYVYTLQNDNVYSALTLVMGTASLVGMAIAPLLMKKLGKKWTQIITNALYGIAACGIVISPGTFGLVFPCMYIANACAAVQIISVPAMNADALDYQQWKTGDRLEGFSGNFSIISSLIVLGTNLVIPFINEMYGLVNNYDVLFVPEIRDPMYRIFGIMSIVGSVLVTIPYLFWTMTSKDHKKMIDDLKQRAIEEDRAAGLEETQEELDARLKGITVEVLLQEKLIAGHITQEEFDEKIVFYASRQQSEEQDDNAIDIAEDNSKDGEIVVGDTALEDSIVEDTQSNNDEEDDNNEK